MSDSFLRSVASMGTVVTVQVVGHGETAMRRQEREAAVLRALDWFETTTERCSRFLPSSEVSRACARVGEAVTVSPLVFEAIRFALSVAEATGGAFDPTIGGEMEARGFNREFRSGAPVGLAGAQGSAVSYRDVRLDQDRQAVTIQESLILDLGAIAKGMAVDLAARELAPFENFAIDAGGDLYLAGHNPEGERWSVGIRHPRARDQLIATLRVSGVAVATSGDYERTGRGAGARHHLVDARSRETARGAASATVVAPSAMVADALSTAAFVLGPEEGLALLRAHAVEGMIVTPDLQRVETPGFPHAN